MSQCPTCGKEVPQQDNPYRPFCSQRCKLVDLGKWVSEEYRVPGKTVSQESTDEDDDEDKAESKRK